MLSGLGHRSVVEVRVDVTVVLVVAVVVVVVVVEVDVTGTGGEVDLKVEVVVDDDEDKEASHSSSSPDSVVLGTVVDTTRSVLVASLHAHLQATLSASSNTLTMTLPSRHRMLTGFWHGSVVVVDAVVAVLFVLVGVDTDVVFLDVLVAVDVTAALVAVVGVGGHLSHNAGQSM